MSCFLSLNYCRRGNIPTATCGGIRRAVVLWTISLFALGMASQMVIAQPQVTGKWVTLSYTMPVNPIHVGLMHTGQVLIVAGSENNPINHNKTSKAAVWDLGGGDITKGKITRTRDLNWDVFCNGWAFFPDGRCFVIGGTAQYDPFHGEARTTVFDPLAHQFDPAAHQFCEMQNMAHGRWYATGIVLPDGRIMTFSGLDENGKTNNTVEFYTVGSGFSSPFAADYNPILYPWLHLLPDGKVVNSGGSSHTFRFDPANPLGNWQDIATTSTNLLRTYGNSVLLPLLPSNNYAARVMILGGGAPNATASTEIIDFSQPTPHWVRMGDMPSGARVEGNSVLLPNGKLFVQGGSAINENASTATLNADLFDPATLKWSSPKPGGAGKAQYPRLYHSVALLLPDATVATAGSNPVRGTSNRHIEIYSPAYLFNADGSPATRPVIASVPAQIANSGGATFQVQTPDAPTINSVVLIKPGSDTHAFDMEQRLVGLPITARTTTTLTVTWPNSPPTPPNLPQNLAPPGYYMLFVLKAGVPSVAKFVQVVPATRFGDQPPKGTITMPSGDVTITAGQSVNFAGRATDADGSVQKYSWFFPEGTPDSSSVPSPGPIVFSNPGTWVVSLTVVDNKGVNDQSPPTRTITVQP
jgi:hypothetical protein